MKLLLPIIIALLGLAGGVGVGVVLKPPPEPMEEDAEKSMEIGPAVVEKQFEATDSEYVEMTRKLIVPVVAENGDKALVAIELHLEVDPGFATTAVQHEPKVRDAFLRTLIWFATTGAFNEDAHPNETFEELGRELTRAAQKVLGESVRGVLIGDMIKQRV